jgi:hypothetical protein
MASMRHRFAVLACALGAVTLVIGIGAASGEKLKTKSESTTLSSGEFDSVTAKCKRGTKAVAGGFESDIDPAGPDTTLIIPYMSRAEGGRKWSSASLDFGDSPGELTSFAYCRDQKVKRRSSEATLSEEETETVTARCPRGTKVASGGFDNPEFFNGPGGTLIFPFESMKTGKREWSVSARNFGDPGQLVAQVNCHERKGLKTAVEDTFIGSPGVHDAVAECAPGRRVVSGGFDYSLQPSEGAFVFSSHKIGKRSWEVEALDLEADATLTAYAYCEKKT